MSRVPFHEILARHPKGFHVRAAPKVEHAIDQEAPTEPNVLARCLLEPLEVHGASSTPSHMARCTGADVFEHVLAQL